MTAGGLAIFDDLSAIAVFVDRQSAIFDFTHGFLKLTGRTPDELRGRTLGEFTSPKDRECLLRVLVEAADDRELRRVDADMLAEDGELRIAWSCSPIAYSGNDLIAAWGIEIAAKAEIEHKKTEEALRLSEHRLRLSLKAAHLGTWQFDLNSSVFTVDETGNVLHGLDPDEMIETMEQGGRYLHPDDIPGIQRSFERAVAECSTYSHEYRVVHRDGQTRWVASLGMLQPGTSSFFGIVEDVTARKRVELDLQYRQREQEHTLQLLLETAAQGILSVDAAGLIVMANNATETMFGWARGELVGLPLERLVPTAFSIGNRMDSVGVRKDGCSFPIEISLNHGATAGGGHAIAFVTDISARKQAEEALHRSYAELERRTLQLRRLASQLTLAEQHAREQLARMLHDGLQQLLFSAKVKLDRAARSDFQADQAGLLHKTRADIDEAIEAARTLSVNLFPPLLHMGGLPATLAWLAKRTEEQFRIAVNLTADRQANPDANDVRILLFEAVRELLFNAVKHAHVDRVDVNLELRSDDTIHIRVSDKGVGFEPDAASNHEKEHQSGLGLFSIQERFVLLGGHLDIQSAPGQGAQFDLTVPRTHQLHRAASNAAQTYHSGRQERLASDDPSGSASQPLRILIADDHVVVRAGLQELFSERPGLLVLGEATNGVEAISQAADLQPDVIVMDVSMPKMNGIEAAREIHGSRPNIHIVGLSTYDDEISERSMREAGAEAYFTKNEGTDRLLDYLLTLRVRVTASRHQANQLARGAGLP